MADPKFTAEDKKAWKAIFDGEAKGNIKALQHILEARGTPVSYQSLFLAFKEGNWVKPAPGGES